MFCPRGPSAACHVVYLCSRPPSLGTYLVIGHTEGTAGIAGLLKASLAVQHGVVPANMLFDTLSPNVAPFYSNLRIVTENGHAWPAVPPGQPRRASVNSFGFGGTNAQ